MTSHLRLHEMEDETELPLLFRGGRRLHEDLGFVFELARAGGSGRVQGGEACLSSFQLILDGLFSDFDRVHRP